MRAIIRAVCDRFPHFGWYVVLLWDAMGLVEYGLMLESHAVFAMTCGAGSQAADMLGHFSNCLLYGPQNVMPPFPMTPEAFWPSGSVADSLSALQEQMKHKGEPLDPSEQSRFAPGDCADVRLKGGA